MSPKVSVIMPVYNAEHYLKESVESILNQTFQDFEFIIIDDCSTDRSWQIIGEYAARDPRIVALQNEQNLKDAGTRNRGMDIAKGQYLAVQDADDISLPERLEKQVRHLDENPHIGALGVGAYYIDQQGRFARRFMIFDSPDTVEARLSVMDPLVHSSMMIRRELMQQIGGYDAAHYYVADYIAWAALMKRTRISCLPHYLLLYRQYQSPNRMTTTKKQQQITGAQQISYDLMQWLMGDTPLDEEAYKRLWITGVGPYRNYKIQRDDLKRLTPLWDFLAAKPFYRQEWGVRLLLLIPKMIQMKRFDTLVPLLRLVFGKLRMYTPRSAAFAIGYLWYLNRSWVKPRHVIFPGDQSSFSAS